jgi:hypothetical protein
VRDTIIHIPTYGSSNKIQGLVVVFVPCQLTLGLVVVSILVILAIKDHKLYGTFLHVTFRSQSLLKLTSDQIGSKTN